ncbi:MAG: hypothetical protein ACRC2K_10265 [Clostridium sp.]
MYTCSLCNKEFEVLKCCLCDECKCEANASLRKGFERRKILQAEKEVYNDEEVFSLYEEKIGEITSGIKEILYSTGYSNKIYEYKFKSDKNGILMWFLYKGKVFSLEYLWDKSAIEGGGNIRNILKFYVDKNLKAICNLPFNDAEYEEIDNEIFLVNESGINCCLVKGFISRVSKILEEE